MKTNHIPDTTLEDAAKAFAALGSEQRLLVLRTLVRAGPDGLPIGELGRRAGLRGATLTHHVRFLAEAGLVTQVRQGRNIICAATSFERLKQLSEFLLAECCADSADEGPHS